MNASAQKVDVLILGFNRPDLLARVIEPLKGNEHINRVFVALDGPRPSKPEEGALIDECEKLVRDALTGYFPIIVLRRERNLGMKKGVVEAIDWFFSQTGSGVIIEDDCLVSTNFIEFSRNLLHRYSDDLRVMGICASRYPGAPPPPEGASYDFVRNFGVWGWATWARAWAKNAPALEHHSSGSFDEVLRRQGAATFPFRKFWIRLLNRCRKGENPSWSFPWVFSAWSSGGLFIRPGCNLVQNIGFDIRATQTTVSHPILSNLVIEPMTFPLVHPLALKHHVNFDKWMDKKIKGIGWILEIKLFVKNLLKVSW